MLPFSLHLLYSRTNAAITRFVACQTQFQACRTGPVLKAGWINEYFQNGYLSDGLYPNIFMIVSGRYSWTAVLVMMRLTNWLRSTGHKYDAQIFAKKCDPSLSAGGQFRHTENKTEVEGVVG